MRQSQSAVLERGVDLVDTHETEPFEVAWAGEARWYVHFLRPAAGTTVEFRVQISPDGLNWIDHEAIEPRETEAIGFISIPVTSFGHWLRLQSRITSGSENPLLRIYLALKE
ncbi:hypothetical protein E4V99_04875 [Microbacterium sp. dk485]|uniref:hypothetical protein n=1 Tax=Microbacterium sp. dk485 TaxID=2560021 RepID=UPI0010734E9C|nr:hypothetical protein [Microbacterium sp. dk485]TFV84399.1 hypothetical protein E4V99_04875 [Microbacterium sp. dk485]